ncbi:hypothetical protein [Longimicrobium sp.]|uniref:hypothetical protein n=1 Tax=Longimicrobium sp. TaxID=2029185 RepID=UPI002E3571EC|nr:hypothetical protein [Longimicrobium sp.]HEX6037340.1 hypothetical protein [Longimicrobium sp.]
MVTYLYQLVASGLLLLLGLQARLVLRRAGPARRDRVILAWSVCASYFLVCGGYSAFHAVSAAVGALMGTRSLLFHWVMAWAISANLARGMVAVAFGALLLVVMLAKRRETYRLVQLAPLIFAVVAITGTVAARLLRVESLFGLSTGLAVLSMLTAMLLMGALWAAVLNDGMDQLLWFCMVLYGLKETLMVSQMAVLAWWTVAPQRDIFYFFYASNVVLSTAMCVVAARRLRLAGAGRRVPALFERMYTTRRHPAS